MENTSLIIIVIGIALRLAAPILVTISLAFVLNRLNKYWQAEVEIEAETEEQLQPSLEKANKDAPVHAHI